MIDAGAEQSKLEHKIGCEFAMVSVKFTKPSIDISPAWGLCIWLSKFLVVVPNIMKSLERVTFSTNSMESSAVESRNHLMSGLPPRTR